MTSLLKRAQALADGARRDRVRRIADEWRLAGGVTMDEQDSAVTLTGRGLTARLLASPSLRFAGRTAR